MNCSQKKIVHSSKEITMAQMKKTAAKKAASKPSTIAQVAKRFNITAREARDIATAVSTAARAVTNAGNPIQ
jgi:hypothetical protein